MAFAYGKQGGRMAVFGAVQAGAACMGLTSYVKLSRIFDPVLQFFDVAWSCSYWLPGCWLFGYYLAVGMCTKFQ
jgi:hypothetical protein